MAEPTTADWQPIETRPRKGHALAWGPGHAVQEVFFGSVVCPSWATHWAPLPAPPEGTPDE